MIEHLPCAYKSLDGFEEKSNEHGQEIGTFHGLASTFGNIDRGGDVVIPGAFKGTEADQVALLWQHDQKQPLGTIDHLKETGEGLEFKASLLLGVQKAREAYELLKGGAIKATSIGYRIKQGGHDFQKFIDPTTQRSRKVRRLKMLDTKEISLVTVPMNPKAIVRGVKSEDGELPDLREFEEWLREEANLTRSEAKCVIARGYAHLLSEKAGQVDTESAREAGSEVGTPSDDAAEHEEDITESSTKQTDDEDEKANEEKALAEIQIAQKIERRQDAIRDISKLLGDI